MQAIYIATCLERRADAEALAAQLIKRGHVITSRWHIDPHNTRAYESTLSQGDREGIATENVRDVLHSDVVIFLADARCRGALLELGVGIGRAAEIIAVGDPTCVTLMASWPGIAWVHTTDDVLDFLEAPPYEARAAQP